MASSQGIVFSVIVTCDRVSSTAYPSSSESVINAGGVRAGVCEDIASCLGVDAFRGLCVYSVVGHVTAMLSFRPSVLLCRRATFRL